MSQSLKEIGLRSTIRKGLPVTIHGFRLYPIKMSQYEEFENCKNAIALRVSSLPVKYISKDYITAVFDFEMDMLIEKKQTAGILARFVHLLLLSLRIENNKENQQKLIVVEKSEKGTHLKHFSFIQDGREFTLSPSEISFQVRPIIAQINGIELPDESDNLDLVIANEQKVESKAQDAARLKTSVDDLISSVAYLSGCRERDVDEWTVREFELRRRAIDRNANFMLYGQASLSGFVSFKKGNPYPSWCYDLLDESLGTQALSELSFGNVKQKEN